MPIPKPLEQLFPDAEERIIADVVLDYFRNDYHQTQQPVSIKNPVLIAILEESFCDLVEGSEIRLEKITGRSHSSIKPEDVQAKVSELAPLLAEQGYLFKFGTGYIYNSTTERF